MELKNSMVDFKGRVSPSLWNPRQYIKRITAVWRQFTKGLSH